MKADSVLLLQKSGTFLALSLNLDCHRPPVCAQAPTPQTQPRMSLSQPRKVPSRVRVHLGQRPSSSGSLLPPLTLLPISRPWDGGGQRHPKRAIFTEANRGLQPCVSTFIRNRQCKGSFSILWAKDQRLDRRIAHCSVSKGR